MSIDALSRVLVDVQLDSSKILDDILTTYQRSLLEVMFQRIHVSRRRIHV